VLETKKHELLRQEEKNLIQLCRDTRYGEVVVRLKDGRPVMASVIKRDVKLD